MVMHGLEKPKLMFNILGENSFLVEMISVKTHHHDRKSACTAKKLLFLFRKELSSVSQII
jgi:hypothetical protein